MPPPTNQEPIPVPVCSAWKVLINAMEHDQANKENVPPKPATPFVTYYHPSLDEEVKKLRKYLFTTHITNHVDLLTTPPTYKFINATEDENRASYWKLILGKFMDKYSKEDAYCSIPIHYAEAGPDNRKLFIAFSENKGKWFVAWDKKTLFMTL